MRILLIANVAWWILGEICCQINNVLGRNHTVYFITEPLIHRNKIIFNELIKNVDIIHSMSQSSVAPIIESGVENLPPIVTWIHHFTSWSEQHQRACNLSSAIIASTQEWANKIGEKIYYNRPIYTVNYGVDGRLFKKTNCHNSTFGIPRQKFVVGFVASKGSNKDDNRKGINLLVQIINKAKKTIPNLHVAFLGGGWSELIKMLSKNGISSSCCPYVSRHKLPEFYSSLDVYLMTSSVEGGPCTVLEAMACQVPVIATRVGMVPELIKNFKNGYSFNVGDVISATNAIISIYKSDNIKIDKMTYTARETVLQYSWRKSLDCLDKIYEDSIHFYKRKQLLNEKNTNAQVVPLNRFKQSKFEVTYVADCLMYAFSQIKNQKITMINWFVLCKEMLIGANKMNVFWGIVWLINGAIKNRRSYKKETRIE